jgi:hypothetical protein
MNIEGKSNPSTTDLPATDLSAAGLPESRIKPNAVPVKLSKMPGLIAISLYMILLAGVIVVHVVSGVAQPFLLIFAVFFIAGALGMLMLLRWAWALTLAAVALFAGWFLWSFTTQHVFASLMQGLLNLVFFLYLVRSDVREKLH